MQVNVNHLMKRGNTYYFRTRVPSELIDTFGCREIKRSLKTNDLHKAELTCKLLGTQMNMLFETGGTDMVDPKIIQEKIAGYVEDSLRGNEITLATYGKFRNVQELERDNIKIINARTIEVEADSVEKAFKSIL